MTEHQDDAARCVADQAAEQLRRLADADPRKLKPLPPLNLRMPRSRAFTVAQVQRLIREALEARDAAILATIQPALREVLRQLDDAKTELAERENDVPARIAAEMELDDARAEAERLTRERDEAREAIRRTTAQMNEYGRGTVNVRQVINLLSPTWPDGNYASLDVPRHGQEAPQEGDPA